MAKNKKKTPSNQREFSSSKTTPDTAFNITSGYIRFSFRFFDNNYSKSLYETHDIDFARLGERLKSYEQCPWMDISRNPQNHPVPLYELDSCHQKQLANYSEFTIDSEIWSLRMSFENRIWGYPKATTFYIIWWDPLHNVFDTIHKN